MLHAFKEALLCIGRLETMESLSTALREELKNEIYQNSSLDDIDVLDVYEQYLQSPLKHYNSDTADLFLTALGMAFKVNVMVFKSDHEKCVILDLANAANNFQETLHFVRTLSVHLDPVVPLKRPYVTIGEDDDLTSNDSDGSDCMIVDECKVFDPHPQQHPLKNIDSNNQWGYSSSHHHQTGMASSMGNLKSEQGNLSLVSPVSTAPERDGILCPTGFDHNNPSAEMLLRCIIVEPSKYEVRSAPKGVRENRMFTVQTDSIFDITCDDNGTYRKKNQVTTNYYAHLDENGVRDVRSIHGSKGCFYYKSRVSRSYENIAVDDKAVFTIVRYYRRCTSIDGLKVMIASASNNGYEYPHRCVVYSRSKDYDNDQDVYEIPCVPHGNAVPHEFPKPYYRRHPIMLEKINRLAEKDSPTNVYHTLMNEAGGSIYSLTPSMEPVSASQISKRKSMLKEKSLRPENPIIPTNDLDKLLAEQRNPTSPVRTVLVFDDCYVAFLYTDKQLRDIELFCCNENDSDSSVLGIDTTFKLCDLWLTDTSYRNKRLVSRRSGKHPVFMGPVMFHFSKDEPTFRRFCAELISANPNILNLKKCGVDMEAAIYSGFKSVIPRLMQLYCVRHLQQRDIIAIEKCAKSSQLPDSTKELYKSEILWDIYGKRTGETFEKGLADSTNENDMNRKLSDLKPRWDKLCPGFYAWFVKHRKSDFITSVIKSAREGTNVEGLFYQNDIESQHAKQKRLQRFKASNILEAVNTVKQLIEHELEEEARALYDPDKHYLSPPFKDWYAPGWRTWTSERRETHLCNFRGAIPSIESSFVKPLNAGRKPGHLPRRRLPQADYMVDRHVQNVATTPSFVMSSTATTTTTTLTSTSTTATTTTLASTSTTPTTSMSISFQDPRTDVKAPLELHCKSELKGGKLINVCRASNCSRPISAVDKLVVRTYSNYTYYDVKSKKEVSKYGPRFIHFVETCLKDYDTATYNKWYAPHESYDYGQIVLDAKSKSKLNAADLNHLAKLGVSNCDH